MPPAPSTSADALAQLNQYSGTLQTPQAAMDAAKSSLGVNAAQSTATGLQGAIQNTTNLLNQVAPSTYGRTQNSLVTDAQADQQIANSSAPLQKTLDKEGTDYGNAEDSYKTLLGEADTEATNTISDQANREGYLQNIYSDLSAKEQNDIANQLNQQKLAEQAREADLTAKSAAGSGGVSIGSGASGGSSGGGASATYGLKVAGSPGSGYYFRDASGNPISALQYSQATGTNYQGLIQKMADSGDAGAKAYLKLGDPTSASGPYSAANLQLIKDFI